jgi:ubiquinone/menaquinone biosynthesis C-methylase UbiE
MPPRAGAVHLPADHRGMHEAVWSGPDAIAKLDDPRRGSWEDPHALWRRVGLRPGMTVVDVGAGTGYYAFPAAERVGRSGRVFAVDRSPELVRLLRRRARELHRPNVVAVRSRIDRIPLRGGIADRVILANVLHGLPPSTIAEAVRVLRPGGRLVDVDAKRSHRVVGPVGPPFEHRLSVRTAQEVLGRYDLRRGGAGSFGPYLYVVVMVRPRRR